MPARVHSFGGVPAATLSAGDYAATFLPERLGRDRRFTLAGRDTAIDVVFDRNYPYAQVYAPRGKPFVAIEPMTAPTNALLTGDLPTVASGDRFAAAFAVHARQI